LNKYLEEYLNERNKLIATGLSRDEAEKKVLHILLRQVNAPNIQEQPTPRAYHGARWCNCGQIDCPRRKEV